MRLPRVSTVIESAAKARVPSGARNTTSKRSWDILAISAPAALRPKAVLPAHYSTSPRRVWDSCVSMICGVHFSITRGGMYLVIWR